MNRPRLSVCIATMNRADFIGHTLESILTQSPPDVEVVILDGGSKDATPEIVAELARRHPQVRYIRQERPGGVDQDFDRAVQEASGEHCWLMSDDDILRPGAMQKVLQRLEQGLDLLVVNAEVRNVDLSRVLRDRLMTVTEDRDFSGEEWPSFFVTAAGYLSFIGGVVIRRSLWMARERQRYHGTVFAHVGVIFQSPIPGRVGVLAEPLISIRYGNALWTSKSFEIWMFKWPGLIWSFESLGEEEKKAVVRKEPWRSAWRLLQMRATGAYGPEEYRMWIRPRTPGLLQRFLPAFISRIPGVLVNSVLLLGLALLGRRRISYVDLVNSRFYWRRMFSGGGGPPGPVLAKTPGQESKTTGIP